MSKQNIKFIDEDHLLGYVQAEYQPEEVFDREILDNWANKNGYTKEDS